MVCALHTPLVVMKGMFPFSPLKHPTKLPSVISFGITLSHGFFLDGSSATGLRSKPSNEIKSPA